MPEKKEIILLLETSAEVCSVAIVQAEKMLAHSSRAEKNSHSKYLAPMVQDLLKTADLGVSDLDAVAISGGPGSYTGLRIGASFAKAICYAAGIPLISVSSLKAIASALIESQNDAARYVAMIDARRMDAYLGIYDNSLNTLSEQFCTLSNDIFTEFAQQGKVVYGGSSAEKFTELEISKEWVKIETESSALHLHNEALSMYRASEFEDLAYYEPNYIKSVHITAKKQTHFN